MWLSQLRRTFHVNRLHYSISDLYYAFADTFGIGTSADNPIEILEEEEIGTRATNPIAISDSEDEPGASVDGDGDGGLQPPTHAPDNWPSPIPYWTHNRGVRNAQFQDVDLGTCTCRRACSVGECKNARSATFCDSTNCSVGSSCGNRLLDYGSLRLVPCIKGLGVVTTSEIPPLTVVGEYCGYVVPRAELTIEQRSHGFVLKFKSKDTNGKRVYLDAYPGGSMCRFVNHSCSPNCRFEERTHRATRKMVIITERQVNAGEEITVRYKKKVPFVCLCGEANCQSRREG
jgi:hypothetical protein